MAQDRPAAAKGVFTSHVVSNTPLCREHWRTVLEIETFPPAAPGQFVEILCAPPADEAPCSGLMLRRPFSIGGLRRSGSRCEVDILHRAIGRGTRWLAERRPADPVSVLGPLGHPFTIPPDRPFACLVGGGIGLPPLIWLAEALRAAGREAIAFCGSRSADLLPLCVDRAELKVSPASGSGRIPVPEFARVGVPSVIATDDGSLGAHGRIPDVFAAWLDRCGRPPSEMIVYACGPEAMIRATAATCEARGIPCQVCLERMMACGMGTCQSCVVRIRDAAAPDGWRYRLCCTDGPVFDSRVVLWD